MVSYQLAILKYMYMVSIMNCIGAKYIYAVNLSGIYNEVI